MHAPRAAPTIEATELLRAGLLDGVGMILAGAHPPTAPAPLEQGGVAELPAGRLASIATACGELGARVSVLAAPFDGLALEPSDSDPAAFAGALRAASRRIERSPDATSAAEERFDLLVVDGADLFARARASDAGLPPDQRAVGRPLDESAPGPPSDERAALLACLDGAWNVTRAVVNGAFMPGERGGRILYLAPSPGAGTHAQAARAGLENLARTLSVEWARRAITVVAIAPADDTSNGQLATLVAYLASPAGAYFSGCLLDMGGPACDMGALGRLANRG